MFHAMVFDVTVDLWPRILGVLASKCRATPAFLNVRAGSLAWISRVLHAGLSIPRLPGLGSSRRH